MSIRVPLDSLSSCHFHIASILLSIIELIMLNKVWNDKTTGLVWKSSEIFVIPENNENFDHYYNWSSHEMGDSAFMYVTSTKVNLTKNAFFKYCCATYMLYYTLYAGLIGLLLCLVP